MNNGRVSRILVSLIVVILCLSSITVLKVKAQEPDIIIIQADGSIDGTNKIKREGNTYTLTSDIYFDSTTLHPPIFILKDNITLNGAGHTIEGRGGGIGIHLQGKQNVEVKNFIVKDFGTGISLFIAPAYDPIIGERPIAKNNKIINNTITSKYWGIELSKATGTVVANNTIISTDPKYGADLNDCNYTTFYNNKFYGGSLTGVVSNNEIYNNTIDDKPLEVLIGKSNKVIDGAGQVVLLNCNNIEIKNVVQTNDLRETIQLFNTNNSKITNNKGRITLSKSNHNIISNNYITEIGSINSFTYPAILIEKSNHNSVFDNYITKCESYGIGLDRSEFNKVYRNFIVDCSVGVRLIGSNNNSVYQNNLKRNSYGVYLSFERSHESPWNKYNSIYENIISFSSQGLTLSASDDNIVFRNSFSNCTEYGIVLFCADRCTFYNNNFVFNRLDVGEDHTVWTGLGFEEYYGQNNTWSKGDVGGNYWKIFGGGDQDGDGFGDSSHLIYEDITDFYPLIDPVNISIPLILVVSFEEAISYANGESANSLLGNYSLSGRIGEELLVDSSGNQGYLMWLSSDGRLFEVDYLNGLVLGEVGEVLGDISWVSQDGEYIWNLDFVVGDNYWILAKDGAVLVHNLPEDEGLAVFNFLFSEYGMYLLVSIIVIFVILGLGIFVYFKKYRRKT